MSFLHIVSARNFIPLGVDIIRSSARSSGLRCRPSDDARHSRIDLLHLLRTCTSCQVQCDSSTRAQGQIRKGTLFRGTAHPVLVGACRAPILLGQKWVDRGKGGNSRWSYDCVGKIGRKRRSSCREPRIRCMGRDDGK